MNFTMNEKKATKIRNREVNLRERVTRTPPQSSNKAEPTLASKPRGDVTRSPKQAYQWPHKWTCVQQKFKKKKKKKIRNRFHMDLVYVSVHIDHF